MTTQEAVPTDAPSAPAFSGDWRVAALWFAGLIVLGGVVFHDAVTTMVDVWWNDVTYNHGFLIAPIAAWLVWRNRGRLAAFEPEVWPLALIAVAACVAALFLGRLADVNVVRHFAFVGLVISLAALIFGPRVAWELKFPLLFLLFMAPFGAFLVPHLQEFTADFAVWWLRFTGVPTFREGIIIQIPAGWFEVAEACAGIRFLIANVVIAFLFAHLAYEKWWKWAAFIALALVIPVIANGFRAYGIIIIAHLTDMEYAVGADHLVYGWGFFAVVMLLLLFIGNLFADTHVGDDPPALGARVGGPARLSSPAFATAAGLMLLAPAYEATIGGAVGGPAPERLAPITEARAPSPLAEDGWRPEFANADANYLMRFGEGAAAVDVFFAYYSHQREGVEAVAQGNDFHEEEGWLRLETQNVDFGTVGGLPARARLDKLGSVYGARRLVASWYWVAGRLTADQRKAKLFQVLAKLPGGEPRAGVLALSTAYDENEAAALERLRAFAAEMVPAPQWLGRIGAGE